MPNKKKLYEALKSEGYDNFSDEASFNAYVEDAGNRKKLFDALRAEGYDNFDSEDSFDDYLGYSKPYTHEYDSKGNLVGGTAYDDMKARGLVDDITQGSSQQDPFEANVERLRRGLPTQKVTTQSVMDANKPPTEIADSEIERLRGIKETAQKQIDSAGFFDRFFDADTRAAVAARNEAEAALETYEEAKHADEGFFDKNVMGVLRGVVDKIGDLSTWDFGASGVASGVALKNVSDKLERGEALSASERNMLDAFGLAAAVNTAYQDKVGMAYKAGQGLPESASFMVSLALNPAAGLGRKVAEKAAKAAVKKYGTSMVGKLAKGAARVGGDMAEMAVATATTGAGRVAEDYYNRLNGHATFDIDENGIIRYGGQVEQEEADTAIWKAFGSQFIENYSESVGNYFTPMGNMLSQLTSKGLKAAHLGKLADVVNDLSSSQFSRGLKRFKDATKFDGFVGEYLEEVAGNFMNAATVGDMNFNSPEDPNSVFNPDVNMQTALSCALMSGTIYAVEAPVSVYNKGKAKLNLHNADKEATRLWGEGWADLRDQMDEADPELLAQLLTGVKNSTELSDEQKGAAMNYAMRLMQFQGYNSRKLQNRMESTDEANAINNAYDEGTDLSTPYDKHSARRAYDRAEAALGEDEAFINEVRAGESNPVAAVNAMAEAGRSDEEIQKAKDYYTSLNRMKGMTDALLDRVNSQIESANKEVDANTNEGNGMVTQVVLRDGSFGYVVTGNVAAGEDGVVDVNNSNSYVHVRLANGEIKPMNPHKDFVGVAWTESPEKLKNNNNTVLKQKLINQGIGEIDWNPSTPNPKVGDSFEVNGVPVTIVSHDGKGGMFVVPTEEFQAAANSEQKMQELVAKAQQTQPIPATEYKNWASARLDAQEDAQAMAEEAVVKENFTTENDASGNGMEPVKEKRPMTENEANNFISRMGVNAEPMPTIEFTPENWQAAFGENGTIETPIGTVKMGENQISKLFLKKRTKEFGMIAPTLSNPDIIIEETSSSKDGQTERESSYLFVKTFVKDGQKVRYYTSVTVLQDGMEVSISSHVLGDKQVPKKLMEGNVIYIKEALSSNSSDGHLAEQPNAVPDLLPTQENNASLSTNKDSEKNVQSQENEQNFVEMGVEKTLKVLGEQLGEKLPHKVEVTANAWANDLSKAQQKVEKAQEELDNAAIGRDAKQRKALEKAEKELADIQREADFWASVDAEVKAAQARRDAILNPQAEIETSEEPMNADELIAQQLASGNIVLDSESFERETGYGSKEKQALNGGAQKLFKAGGMTIEEAGERLMEIDRENGTNFFDQSDSNAGRDALISFLGSVSSRKEINGYIKNNRQMQQESANEALKNEIEQQIMDEYGMTAEEYVEAQERGEVNNTPEETEEAESVDETVSDEWEDPLGEELDDVPFRVAENESKSRIADVFSEATRIAAQHRKEQVKARAAMWEAAGVKVKVHERISGIHNMAARKAIMEGKIVSGWFDGEVHVYIPHISSLAELDKTILHEAIAHKGLRELLGEENFGVLCDKVWEMMPQSAKDEFISYPGVNGNTRAAADEYMAHLAENESLSPEEKTLWQKIVQWFKDLFTSKVDNKEQAVSILNQSRLTKNDISDLVKLSYSEYLKNSGRAGESSGYSETRLSAKKKRALETASVSRGKHQPTVVSSADGANILNNLDSLAKEYEEKSSRSKTFLGDVANAIGARKQGSGSQYATFETVNGNVVTIRLADHNATVSNFDNRDENEGISIVVSAKDNNGITNDGDAHIVEYFYDSIDLRRADGKPLAEIVKSIKQSLYSGEYKDTTGLAERQEVNGTRFRITKEEQSIIDQAKTDGTYMKAPNGESTNLTEKQWAQVRTKAFKKWFGDWEKEPKNSSKIVDENGEPLVVYHGSEEDFNVFDKTKGRANMDIQGMFFSPWDDDARGYGSNVRAFYLNIKNPANESAGYKALRRYQGQNGAGIKAREYLVSLGYDGVNNEEQEFIAFESNQIKSATNNNGKFDSSSDDIRFRFIGEKGARNLDKAEEATTRLDNLAVARDMEAAEKDAKTIKMATGWERGADGLWRYEVKDFFDVDAMEKFVRVAFNKTFGAQVTLGRILKEEDTLLKEYPQLKDVAVKFQRLGDAWGVYYPESNVIAINSNFIKEEREIKDKIEIQENSVENWKNPEQNKKIMDMIKVLELNPEEELKNAEDELGKLKARLEFFQSQMRRNLETTIIHEVQHAIQHIEGFTHGGNEDTVRTRKDDLQADVRPLYDMMLDTPEWTEKERLVNEYMDNPENESVLSRIDEIDESGVLDKIKELQSSLKDKYGNDAVVGKIISSPHNDHDEIWNQLPDSFNDKYDAYSRIAGEVEARNAASRSLSMTQEDMREYLASETEDVAREDQIFLKDAMEEGVRFRISGHGKQIQAEVEKFTSKYNSKPVVLIDSEMSDEELDGIIHGWTAKEIKDAIEDGYIGGYAKKSDRIYIFADNSSLDHIENTMFHENIHGLMKDYPDILDEFYNNVKKDIPKLLKELSGLSNYTEQTIPGEVFARVAEEGLVRGDLYNVRHYMSKENAEKFVELLKTIGYEYEKEAISRRMDEGIIREISGKQHSGRGQKGMGVQEASGREDGEILEATRRERKARLEELFTRVADMGLQGVLGNKEYDRLMMDIYSVLPKSARAEVTRDTFRHYGTNFVPAVSDYIGAKADGNIMDKIVSIVREALRKVGFDLDLNANEVRYLAWRSKKPLDRNNLLEVADDIDMKNRLKVGEYDGTTLDGGGTRFRVSKEKVDGFTKIYSKWAKDDYSLPYYAEKALESAWEQMADEMKEKLGNNPADFFTNAGEILFNKWKKAVNDNDNYAGTALNYKDAIHEDYADNDAQDLMDDVLHLIPRMELKEATNIEKYIPSEVLDAVIIPNGKTIKFVDSEVMDILQRVTGKSKNEIIEEYTGEGLEMLTDEDFDALQEEGTRFRTVYHGSGASFDKFDHSFMGTGEGAQAYGWGTYVTEVNGIARAYAITMAAKSGKDPLIYVGEYENYVGKDVVNIAKEYLRTNSFDLKKAKEQVEHDLKLNMPALSRNGAEFLLGTTEEDWVYSPNRHLYEVEIPDDNGKNYLYWDKQYNREDLEDIASRSDGNVSVKDLDPKDKTKDGETIKGGKLVRAMSDARGANMLNAKEASMKLAKCGLVGISYPAENRTGGREDNARNYVIFNEKDLEIKEHTRFRVSNKLQVRNKYEALTKKSGYQVREALQDAQLSIRRFQELIEEKTKKKVRGFENVWWHENRLSSMVQSAIHEMERMFYKPMMEAVKKLMKSANVEQEQVADYLMLKHGIERNREMAVRKALTDDHGKIDRTQLEQWYREKQAIRNDASLDTWRKKQEAMNNLALNFGADMSRDYSGLTSMYDTDELDVCTQRAYNEVEALEKAHPAETEALGKAIKAMSQNTLDYAYESGLMDKKVYDELSNDMYDYYIPLRGFDETTSDEVYTYLDNERGAFNSPLRRANGRSSKADNPLAYMKSIAESGITQGGRNRMKNSFLALVLNNPSDLVSVKEGVWAMKNPATGEWEAVSPPVIPNSATPAEVEAIMSQWESDMEQQAASNPDIKKITEPDDIPYRVIGNRINQHQVIVKWNGRSYTLTVNGNPRLAMALNGQTNPNNTSNDGRVAADVQKAIDNMNRTLASWYTTRNPDFVVSNFMRDTFYTNTIVVAKEGVKYARKFHKHYAKLLMPGKMINLFRKYENGTLDMNDSTEKAFYDFMMNGGETGYSNLKDLEDIKKQINKELKGGRLQQVMKFVEKADILNRAIENTSRFAAFLTSREMGRGMEQSIYDAKDISVNFNKKGAGGTFYKGVGQTRLGNLAAAVGAGGRAMYVFFNAALQGTSNIMHVMKKNPKVAGPGAVAMFLIGAAIPMLLDGDDEKDYYDLPEHVRRNHLVIPGAGDAWISIPLPIEYRIMYGMGELMTSWRTGHERGENIAKKALTMTGQALPLNFLEEGFDAFVPSVLSPLWQVYNNKSWTGLPIYKDNEFNKDDPEYTKAYSNVDRGIYNFTKALYDWTFDEESQKSGIDLNPAMIEALGRGWFGGLFTQMSNLGKTLEMVQGDREFDWRSIPLANRALKSGDERTKEKRVTNEYFDNIERLDFLQSRERFLRKTMEGAEVPEADRHKARKDWEELQKSEAYRKYMKFNNRKKIVDRIRKHMKAKGSTKELEKTLSEAQESANEILR